MATPRRSLVVGNWKMNLDHLQALHLVQALAFSLKPAELDRVETVVVPPFTDLRTVQTMVDADRLSLRYGAQDLSPHASGAHTGDISGAMLARLGCSYALVGHSERRQHHGEGDDVVRRKLRAALDVGLAPVLCVGETLAVREAGEADAHCAAQLAAALRGLPPEQAATVVLAYEPVWAIGTDEVATPGDAQHMCAALRADLRDAFGGGVAGGVRVLYGGSVTPDSAPELLACPDVDGALVGGASLSAESFAAIVRAVPAG